MRRRAGLQPLVSAFDFNQGAYQRQRARRVAAAVVFLVGVTITVGVVCVGLLWAAQGREAESDAEAALGRRVAIADELAARFGTAVPDAREVERRAAALQAAREDLAVSAATVGWDLADLPAGVTLRSAAVAVGGQGLDAGLMDQLRPGARDVAVVWTLGADPAVQDRIREWAAARRLSTVGGEGATVLVGTIVGAG